MIQEEQGISRIISEMLIEIKTVEKFDFLKPIIHSRVI